MNEVQQIRESLGMSRAEFCSEFHIAGRTLACWEEGVRNPPGYLIPLPRDCLESMKRAEILRSRIDDLQESVNKILIWDHPCKKDIKKPACCGVWYRMTPDAEYYELTIRRNEVILEAFAYGKENRFPLYINGILRQNNDTFQLDFFGDLAAAGENLLPDPLNVRVDKENDQLILSSGLSRQERIYEKRSEI